MAAALGRPLAHLRSCSAPTISMPMPRLATLLEREPVAQSEAVVFRSSRSTAMPVRSIKNVVAALVRRTGLTRVRNRPRAAHLRARGCISIRAGWWNCLNYWAMKVSIPPLSTPTPRPLTSLAVSNRHRSIWTADDAHREQLAGPSNKKSYETAPGHRRRSDINRVQRCRGPLRGPSPCALPSINGLGAGACLTAPLHSSG